MTNSPQSCYHRKYEHLHQLSRTDPNPFTNGQTNAQRLQVLRRHVQTTGASGRTSYVEAGHMTTKSAYNALSNRRKSFVDGIISGMSQTAAYVAAGYAPEGANANAARLIANDSVAVAVTERRAPVAIVAEVTAGLLVQEALMNLRLAREAGQYSASNRAIEILAKLTGIEAAASVAAPPGVQLTATLSVDELRHVVAAMKGGDAVPLLEERACDVLDVTAVVADAGGAGASDAGGGAG